MSYTDSASAGEVRSEREAKQKLGEVELWLKKIERAKTDKKRETWMRDAHNAVSMYEAGELTASNDLAEHLSGANLWHSNLETVVPALFNSNPLPWVQVRYGEPDPIQKHVCDLVERAAAFDIDSYDYSDRVKEIVRQAEMTGWGVPVMSYKPQIVEIPASGDAAADGETHGETESRIVHDDVHVDCWPWDRFIIPEARSVEKLPWMAFELDMTLDDIDDLCPPEKDEEGNIVRKSDKFQPDQSSKGEDSAKKDTDPDPDGSAGILNTIKVYRIWDKRTKKVWHVTPKDKKFPLKVEDDPLQLTGFFPVPKILYAKRRTSSVQPISPWTVYKGLFQEFEEITLRINGLVSQIKVRGLYDKELEADFEALKDCKDGEYVPAKATGTFAGKGGLEQAVLHWPLHELMAALKEAVEHRERVKQLIFETTGLSDILRGATNPNETLGAQKIKASWGSQRVQDMQEDIAELNRAIIRMGAELRQRFTPWDLVKDIAGIPQFIAQGPDGQQADIEAEVEKAYRARSRVFRVDIETDSTIRADMARDQEQMGNFVNFTGTFMQGAVAAIQLLPETRQPLFELYAAMSQKFKLGRQGEQALQKLVEAASAPPQQQGAPTDPNQQAHEQQMQEAQAAQEQQSQQHEAEMQQRDQAHEQAMAQHDAMTQQTALGQIQMKDQAAANQHQRKLEALQIQRAMPPVNGQMGAMQ